MVRSVTFEIRWHDMQPIYSCSFQPIPPTHLRRVLDFNQSQAAGQDPSKLLAASSESSKASSSRQAALPLNAQGQSWRFATAGGDNHARIWLVHPNIPSHAALAAASTGATPNPPRVEYRATLKRHSGVVNCVRFCPKGELLATTGDDGMMLLWIQSDGPPSSFGASIDDDGDAEFAKEHWRLRTMCRASSSEIYDMAWSPSGDSLVIGGTDFVARIISANDGTVLREISEHNHYIQGVAWDPLAEYIATQSSDRSVHVHQLLTKANEYAAVQTVSRNTRMDVHHRRGGSNNNAGHFLWDPTAKPPMKRSASSHASHASDSEREGPSTRTGALGMRTGRSSTPLDIGAASIAAASLPTAHYSAAASGSGPPRASTPTLSHQSPALTSMNPPQRTPSRRSSFSGSQVEALSPPTSATSLAPYSHPSSINATGGSTPIKTSALNEPGQAFTATASTSRSASRNRGFTPRSPSPAPPLPAIRAPPSPKQRMASAVYQTQTNLSGVGTLAKAGMRLYGDENFSGFFRRLTFSPDGALLVTPTGIFENSTQAALNQMQSPASPTVAAHINRRMSEQDDIRASPASPLPVHPTSGHSPAGPAPAATAAPPVNAANLHKSTVYLYGRGNLHKSNAPIAHLPGHKTASLVIKFSPILYELRKGAGVNKGGDDMDGIAPHPNVPLEVGKQKTVSLGFASSAAAASSIAIQDDQSTSANDVEGKPKTTRSYSSASSTGSSPTKRTPPTASSIGSTPTAMIGLPYRMIFAVATHDSVWIYDTQQGGPLCCFSNMHYASFTDLTWSSDGQTLMMCSTDGYCSVVVFDYGELGVPYQYQSQPSLQSAAAPTSSATLGTPSLTKSAFMAEAPMMLRRESGGQGSNLSSQGQEGIAHGLGLATEIGEGHQSIDSTDDLNPGLKKKRRIAPTLQGPIGN